MKVDWLAILDQISSFFDNWFYFGHRNQEWIIIRLKKLNLFFIWIDYNDWLVIMKINKHQTPEIRKTANSSWHAEIVLLKYGLQNFTIDQVNGLAQIAKVTVHKYYKTKDQLSLELSIKSVNILMFGELKSLFPIKESVFLKSSSVHGMLPILL